MNEDVPGQSFTDERTLRRLSIERAVLERQKQKWQDKKESRNWLEELNSGTVKLKNYEVR